jgi:delta 1-pyrroline-5-carboxylate dehydrogenase
VKLYNIYQVSDSGRKLLVGEKIVASEIGPVIVAAASKFLTKHMGTKKYGQEVARCMSHEAETEWSIYVDDLALPTYDVIEA